VSKQSKEEILVRVVIAGIVIGVLLIIGSIDPTLRMYGL